MLDKDLYDSWKSQMELYMQNIEYKRMILELVENGPLIWPTIKENGVTRTKKYVELSAAKKIQADCDMKATNIILQGLPADICSLSKFVTDVKLVKDLHTTNFDQLYAYLEQHELHANEVRLLRERNQDPLAFVANQQMTPPHFNTYQSLYNNPQIQQQFPPSQYGSIHQNQHYSSTYPSQPQFNHSSVNHHIHISFSVPVFSPGDDPITCLNKAMAFLTVVASSRYKSNATSFGGKNISRHARVVKCYNCQDEEQLTFLADPGVSDGQAIQTIIPNNAAFQTEDLDTYDSDYDDVSNAKAVLMSNISNYGFDVILEVPHSETYLNVMENQSVHEMQNFEQTPTIEFTDNKIHSDSNIILYS
ncbi:hypothetical protein Tco_0740479 [Tanacetum coccineum]